MKRQLCATDLLAGLVVTVLLTGGARAMAAPTAPSAAALTAEEAIACIRTAVTAQAGWVKEVEGDEEKGQRRCTGNCQTVMPGQGYRSGQQGRKHWRASLHHYGIKSLINLRGAHLAARWYQQEIHVAEALGVTHDDVRLSAIRQVDPHTLEMLLTMLRQAPKPLWIHCQSGADRSGLVAALYLFAIEGQRAEAAAQQLSLCSGHCPSLFSRTGAMDRSFWRYARQPSRPFGNTAGLH